MDQSRDWTCKNSECPMCGVLKGWDYEQLATSGQPVCYECGEDMVLVPLRVEKDKNGKVAIV